MGPVIEELTSGDLDEALDVSVAAFAADREFHRAFGFRKPLSPHYIRGIHHLLLLNAFAAKPHPLGVRVDEMLTGIIIYNDARGGRTLTAEQSAFISGTRFQYNLENKGFNPPSMRMYAWLAERPFPKDPFYFVTLLAVLPDAAGRGFGKTLLSAVVEKSQNDPASTGTGITTYSTSAAEFYRHLGFEVLKHRTIFRTNIYTMFIPNKKERTAGNL